MARIDLHLTWEMLERRTWTFGHRDNGPYSRFVRLLPDGRISGFAVENVNERRWGLEGGKLSIIDAWDRKTTVFDEVHLDDEGRLTLLGGFRFHPVGTPHMLKEIPSPAELAPAAGAPELLVKRKGEPRRNLVVLRANEESLHHQWPRELKDDDRTWDLCVSFYGKDENFDAPDFAEYRALQNKQHKFSALYDLLHEGSPLLEYDYVMLPDDDLMMNWRDINEMFALCRDYKLQLAQPALDPSGFANHAITLRQWGTLLRFTSFVELMIPIFSREALRMCVPTFKGSTGGFGLDNIWPKLLGHPRTGLAVLDKTPVVHTRPQGATYDIGKALREGDELQRIYDAHARHLEYGSVLAQPLHATNGW
ncbi:MAG: hypothetical protein KY449_04330 [Proteobacteria bacterium]|nr:hypothetical protein [Pseudomonadota bacterium]